MKVIYYWPKPVEICCTAMEALWSSSFSIEVMGNTPKCFIHLKTHHVVHFCPFCGKEIEIEDKNA